MTLVARGAALYAATAGLDARPVAVAAPAPPTGLAVRIEHPAVTADLEPFVVGKFLPAAGETVPAQVTIEREGGGFTSPETAVSAEGSFALQVLLERHRQCRFVLKAVAGDGSPVTLRTSSFSIVHGVSVADPPLSRSVGVALSDDTVHVYFEKGTPLPARRTAIHQTIQSLRPGDGEDVLLVPVVQGEYKRAHLNRLIGSLRIDGKGLKQSLPAATRVEVTLHLDRSGQLQARADLPSAGLSFEDVVHVLVPTASPEVLEREMQSATDRLVDLRRRSFRGALPAVVHRLAGADALLAEARAGLAPARGGDTDAAQRLHRLLLDLNGTLDAAEDEIRWPELEARADDRLAVWISWVSSLGTAGEQKLCDQAVQAIHNARERRDAAELGRQLATVSALFDAAYSRHPEAPVWIFEAYESHLTEAIDVPKAQALLDQGRSLRRQGNLEALRTVNRQLRALFPGTLEERRKSFGSGVS